MVEEKNGTSNGEMPPQEDSQKSPLTEGPGEVKVEIKAAEEGVEDDAQEQEFTGLTKEQLLEYSKDPFWRNLRIFLMIIFWLGWLVMLVMAVWIIIQAPQCEPLPTLQWLQESPLLEVNINSFGIGDIASVMTSLGLSSFYMPSMISQRDYYILNTDYGYVKETVLETLEELQRMKLKAVTDYVPEPVHRNHPYLAEAEYEDMDLMSGMNLNYSSTYLPAELQKVFEFWKSDYNVTGFLVPVERVEQNPSLANITEDLNSAMEANEIVVGVSSVDMAPVVSDLDVPGTFKQFVMDNYEDWHYYKFNPIGSDQQPNTPERMACVTLAMMLLPGTPLLQVSDDLSAFNSTYGPMVRASVDFRATDSIKFGETQFANTTDNVIAFTRTMKGTPGYAVVLNLGSGGLDNSTEIVDFSQLLHVPESGTLAYSLDSQEPLGIKESLKSVEVGKHEGRVIQFIAAYS